MTKFAFLFVFALFALQGLNASSLKINHSDLVRDDNDVNDFINEVHKIIIDVSTRSSALFLELKQKFIEIETAADFPGLVTELKQNIKQTLMDGGDEADACEDDAWKRVAKLERLASIVSCRFQVDDETTNLRKQLEDLVFKVQGFLAEIGRDVYKCMRESFGNYSKFAQCIKEKVSSIKQELEVVDKAIQETFNILEASVPLFTNKMTECVDNNKQNLISKMTALVEDVQVCIKTNSVMPIGTHKHGAFKIINMLDQIEEIVAKHNLKALFAVVKEDIEKLLATSEKDARLCGPKAHALEEMLVKQAQSDAEKCEATMEFHRPNPTDALDKLDFCLTRVEDMVSTQGHVIVDGLKQCFENAEILY